MWILIFRSEGGAVLGINAPQSSDDERYAIVEIVASDKVALAAILKDSQRVSAARSVPR